VLDEDSDPHGYLLLQCLRSYLELDMYTALEVHTSETIADGRKEILKFESVMKVCMSQMLDLFESTKLCFRDMQMQQQSSLKNLGNSQKCIRASMSLMTLKQKAPVEIITQSLMRNSMAP
jgi:hypothetical protein